MFINEGLNKYTMGQPYNGTLLSHNKEKDRSVCIDTEKVRRYINWKEIILLSWLYEGNR